MFPIAQIVPAEAWKYAAGAACLLALNGALIVAGWLWPASTADTGSALGRIVATAGGSAARWYSTLLLGLSGQIAMLIWWARSKSLNDFDGRYWLWIRVAAVSIVFSGCIAIDAGQAAVDLLRSIRPKISESWTALAWLLPAAGIGVSISRALFAEMAGCRASRILFAVSMACYACAAGVDLGLGASLAAGARALLIQTSLLTGHAALFISMWVHARHVIHCSHDPALSRQRRWRIPRPHFRLPRLPSLKGLRRIRIAETPETATVEPKARRNRPERQVDAEPAAPSEKLPNPSEIDELPNVAASKPRFRLDTRHDEPRPVPGNDSLAAVRETPPAAEQTDQDDDDPASQPDLRGMSKKQRRRIMQELREKERAAREA